MNAAKTISVHIDVDSPIILSRFYGQHAVDYTDKQLEDFYKNTFQRAFTLFDEFNIKATFFCVGEELQRTPGIISIIKEAVERGHAIANHTYTHPFGLNTLSEEDIRTEVSKCNEVIKSITSVSPMGFRSPGVAVDTKVINIVQQEGMQYDSSAGWPLMAFLFKMVNLLSSKKLMNVGYGETNSRFRSKPYIPSDKNWKLKDTSHAKRFYEFPLPSTYLLLPFYQNLLLLFPTFIQNILISGNNSKHLTFLFHSIEFSSLQDDELPASVKKHPHVNIPYAEKLKSHRNLLKKKLKRRTPVLTETLIRNGQF